MTVHYPVLPVAGATLLRSLVAALALASYWLKQVARARRHRRQAAKLAGLDRRMLADIGLTRSDLRDAFSEPFWEDPTALLRERALERRWNRALMRADIEDETDARIQPGFRRPPTDRPARRTM